MTWTVWEPSSCVPFGDQQMERFATASSNWNNWKGRIRDGWGTARSLFSLAHPHLLRLRLLDSSHYRSYAAPLFQRYVQSLQPNIDVVDFSTALELLEIDPESVECSLPVLDGYVGLADWDRVTLAAIARSRSPYPAFEIGTAAGSTAILLSLNIHDTVFSLDLPRDDTRNQFALPRLSTDDAVIAGRRRASLLEFRPRKNVVLLIGDSATFDFTPYYDRIGLFFIDGAHSYEYVRSDTLNAVRCCAEGGVIVWDDYGGSRDVSRFLNQLAGLGVKIYGVEGTKLAFSRDVERIRESIC